MAKETFEDCVNCFEAVNAALADHSLDIVKVVLLSLLRDVLVMEAHGTETLAERADQVAGFIKAGRSDGLVMPEVH